MICFKDSINGIKDPRFDFKVSIMSIPIESRNKQFLDELTDIFPQLPMKIRLEIYENND
jgi:hypothetical protein